MAEKKEDLSVEELQALKYSLASIKEAINKSDSYISPSQRADTVSQMMEKNRAKGENARLMIDFNRLVNEEIASRLEK